MADPLSAVASVVGITDFGFKGINSLRHLYRSHKDAPKKLEQLRNEAPAHWAAMMQLGQVFDAAAQMGDNNFSRMIFDLGEQGNAHLIEFDKLIANDDQLDPKARQRQTTLLLDNGADTDMRNDSGDNAAMRFADYALRGYPEGRQYDLWRKLSASGTLEDMLEDLQYGVVHKILFSMLDTDLREYLEGLEEDKRLEQINHTDEYGRTPLHLAAREDDAETVNILLSFGAKPDVPDKKGRTPLASLAKNRRSAKSFQLLTQRGANIHTKDKKGDSIIHHAAIAGSLDFMEQLYQYGVDINIRNCSGATPLILAAMNNRPWIIERLLKWGTTIEAVDDDNDTALNCAVTQNAHKSIVLLLGKNANPRHVNDVGSTIWHHAAVTADAKTMRILQSSKPTLEDLCRRDMENQTPLDLLSQEFRERQEVWDMFVDLTVEAYSSREVTEEA
ncbi:hypothetical protein E8E14_005266 [Neopestalotiopsis sp. 37M]|nr:hypothetical protein E8E14_005266 [Neopestalotiopsis sp. 37M]